MVACARSYQNVGPTKGGGGPVRGMWSIIAHEQNGTGGQRAVADVRGLAITVTDEEFARLECRRPSRIDQ